MKTALLWLKPEAFTPLPEDALPLEEQDPETAERAFPSSHTCLLCNVLALASALREGAGGSRFWKRGSLPPVYLACAINFERDAAGELFSCEPAIGDHQEQSMEEAAAHEQVRFCLDPKAKSDWLSYFQREYILEKRFELWKGEDFAGNVDKKPSPMPKGTTCLPIFSFSRSSLGACEAEVADAAALPKNAISGGCVVVYRQGPPDAEPFGMWLGWIYLHASLVIVDLQNSAITSSLEEAIALMHWAEEPRQEIFWARFKR